MKESLKSKVKQNLKAIKLVNKRKSRVNIHDETKQNKKDNNLL